MRILLGLGLLGLSALVLIVRHQPPHSVTSKGQSARQSALPNPGSNPPANAINTVLRPGHAASQSHQRGADAITSVEDDAGGSDALEQLTSTLTEAELQTHLNALPATHPDETDVELRRLLLRRWVALNPVAAAAWASAGPEGALRSEVLGHVAIAWANSDLPQALQWVRQLADGESKNSALLNLGYEAARVEPRTAMEVALQLPSDRHRDELLAHAAGQWAAQDPVAAAEWSGKIPDASLRGRFVSIFATAWAEHDAPAAATLAVTSLPAGELQDRAVTAIVQRWAQQSPDAAARWVQQFPAIPIRDVAVQNLVSIWANANPVSAAQWLHDLPAGAVRDRGIAAFASIVAVSAPADADAWTSTISNALQQTQSRESLARLRPVLPSGPH